MKTLNLLTATVLVALSLNVKADDKQNTDSKKAVKSTVVSIEEPKIVWGAPEDIDAVQIKMLDLKLPDVVWGTPSDINAAEVKALDIKLPEMVWGNAEDVKSVNLDK